TGELAKTQRRSLADTLQQSGGEDGGSVVFPPARCRCSTGWKVKSWLTG
ncbi:protein rhsC, partial [Escherichia coli 174750]